MGIRSIMDARETILLASGKEKAGAVRKALAGPVSPRSRPGCYSSTRPSR
ncbi:hypothetical protein ACVNPS_06900 [Candidatus Bipolaricaulota sp. J31]